VEDSYNGKLLDRILIVNFTFYTNIMYRAVKVDWTRKPIRLTMDLGQIGMNFFYKFQYGWFLTQLTRVEGEPGWCK